MKSLSFAGLGVLALCLGVFPALAHEPGDHSKYNQSNGEWFAGTRSALGGCCGVTDAYVFRESYPLGKIEQGRRAEVLGFTKCERVEGGYLVEVWDMIGQGYVERFVKEDAFIKQPNIIGKYIVWVDYLDGKTLRIKCLALEIEA